MPSCDGCASKAPIKSLLDKIYVSSPSEYGAAGRTTQHCCGDLPDISQVTSVKLAGMAKTFDRMKTSPTLIDNCHIEVKSVNF